MLTWGQTNKAEVMSQDLSVVVSRPPWFVTWSIFKKIKASQANPSLPSLPPGCCSSWCWPQWARAPHLRSVELRGRRNPMICHLSDSSHRCLATIAISICMCGSLQGQICKNLSRQEIKLYFNFTLVLQLDFITDTSSISNFWLELIAVTANSVCGRPRILIEFYLKHLNNRPCFLCCSFWPGLSVLSCTHSFLLLATLVSCWFTLISNVDKPRSSKTQFGTRHFRW